MHTQRSIKIRRKGETWQEWISKGDYTKEKAFDLIMNSLITIPNLPKRYVEIGIFLHENGALRAELETRIKLTNLIKTKETYYV